LQIEHNDEGEFGSVAENLCRRKEGHLDSRPEGIFVQLENELFFWLIVTLYCL
jgi:hypothetical protein